MMIGSDDDNDYKKNIAISKAILVIMFGYKKIIFKTIKIWRSKEIWK